MRDLGLEFEEILQRALRDLGLVRRVGGEEFRALDQVIDARRHMVPIGAGADEERHRSGRHIARRHPPERPFDGKFARRLGQGEAMDAEIGRDVEEEIIDRADADGGEHRLPIRLGMGKIAHRAPFD